MIYCNTSLLIAAFTAEARSATARSWMLAQHRSSLAISDWSLTEFANAIARKQQRSDLSAGARDNAEQAWGILCEELTHLTITRAHFWHAARLVDAVPHGLRAGDALHLATLLDHGCGLATFDVQLAEAASSLGVAVHPA